MGKVRRGKKKGPGKQANTARYRAEQRREKRKLKNVLLHNGAAQAEKYAEKYALFGYLKTLRAKVGK